MSRSKSQANLTVKSDIGDLKMTFDMSVKPVDPDNIVASDAHVRMPLEYAAGSGTSDWLRVVDAPSLSAQDKTDLRRIIKLLRDDIHAAHGLTGTPDDV